MVERRSFTTTSTTTSAGPGSSSSRASVPEESANEAAEDSTSPYGPAEGNVASPPPATTDDAAAYASVANTRIGDACNNVAGCVEGSWCVSGACQPLCDTDDFSACGGIPGLCTNIIRGSRLGVCTQ